MGIIDEALSANATIANGYDPSRGGPPAPKIAIVTCADPRLSDIEQMLGLAQGDVDMIRNFGTVIDDDAVRSLVLSTRLLGTREIMIINHTDCGMLRFTDSDMENRLRKDTGEAPIAPAKFYSFTDADANSRKMWEFQAKMELHHSLEACMLAVPALLLAALGTVWLVLAPAAISSPRSAAGSGSTRGSAASTRAPRSPRWPKSSKPRWPLR